VFKRADRHWRMGRSHKTVKIIKAKNAFVCTFSSGGKDFTSRRKLRLEKGGEISLIYISHNDLLAFWDGSGKDIDDIESSIDALNHLMLRFLSTLFNWWAEWRGCERMKD
jgi:hypothetical protein